MKILKSILFATTFMIASFSFANTDDSTPISGNYIGSLETKTFQKSADDVKTSSTKDYKVDFLFNGNVFIYQGVNAKAMGTYKLADNKVTFDVTSTKGDTELVNEIFSHEFQYSKKDGQLMLIGNSDANEDVMIINLSSN